MIETRAEALTEAQRWLQHAESAVDRRSGVVYQATAIAATYLALADRLPGPTHAEEVNQ